jgi:hypothetical protein
MYEIERMVHNAIQHDCLAVLVLTKPACMLSPSSAQALKWFAASRH